MIYAREVRNTMTANSAIAAVTISDPMIGAATNDSPFKSTSATPAGNRIAPHDMQPALPFGQHGGPGRRNQPVIEPKKKQAARRRSG